MRVCVCMCVRVCFDVSKFHGETGNRNKFKIQREREEIRGSNNNNNDFLLSFSTTIHNTGSRYVNDEVVMLAGIL